MYVQQVTRRLAILVILVTLLSGYSQSRDKSQPIGTVLCEDGHASCPVHSGTCCLGLSNKYFCCPLPNAVCCADGVHCCPQCFTCNVKGGSCLRPAAASAAVRIYSLVPSSDKRLQTAAPTPPAAATVAAAARQREIESNKAAALATAIARKKEAEEKEGFVAGVLSAVKLTLFSNGEDKRSKQGQSKLSPQGGQKPQQPVAGVKPPTDSSLKQPPIKPVTKPPQPPSGISRSAGIMASAQPTPAKKQPGKISPQTPPPTSKQTQGGVIKKNTPPNTQPKSTKDTESKEEKSSGFFSSVLSAVTDFYSGGAKEESKPGSPQQRQPAKANPMPTPPKIPQQKTVPQKQPVRTPTTPVGGVKTNKIPQTVGKPQVSQGAVKQHIQSKQQPAGQTGFKPAQTGIKQAQTSFKPAQTGSKPAQTGQKINVGISQKSANAAIAAQEKKAKAWAAKPVKKL